MAQEKKVSKVADIGTVRIADDVVAMIAAFAALDVEGVACMPGDVTRQMISKGGMKKLGRSVKVEVTREGVKADLSIIVEYGYNIPTTSSRVQKRVKNAIEEMTGLAVIDVNIHISGISIPE
ncbi:MAG: Asp23/Gls24 family envelope stress response protein [Lachnospiraceae bacterium]|nr:Asp23/Gls24 family envelope stress response protein [Sarcina sp.]MBQ6590509.1 Asp23/Gls24 family envelope stress response protein [Lachnospiraceae bacterium]